MKVSPMLYREKKDCCGCTACYAVCPINAIKMIKDEEGFEYPEIDGDRCICCNKCVAVCPMKKEVQH